MTPINQQLALLVKEYKDVCEQYAECGANDSELNEALVELFYPDADENTPEYFFCYLYDDHFKSVQASNALCNVAKQMLDIHPSSDDVEFYLNN